MKKIISILLIIAALTLLAACEPIDVNPKPTDTEKEAVDTDELFSDPVTVKIDVRDFGTMTLELYPKVAPITVENFLAYVDSGFYDGLTFHRIRKGFMIQGGDPDGNGTGSGNLPAIKGEFAANGVDNYLSHTYGVISMARTSNNMNSATSQFFICNADASASLDGNYAAFGILVDGAEVLDAISNVEVEVNMFGEKAKPVTPVVIDKIYRAE